MILMPVPHGKIFCQIYFIKHFMKQNFIKCTVVVNKTGPTRVADFRAVFTAERPYLFLGPETTYPVEQ